MKQVALIVAGGKGNRMKSLVPKQFLVVNGLPILMHTIRRFKEFNAEMEILVVLPSVEIQNWKDLCLEYDFAIDHKIVEGGAERFYSVKNGLDQLNGEGIVLIHDGVRPLVSLETIKRCVDQAMVGGNAIPVLPLVESIRKVAENENKMADRSEFVSIQTPQTFQISLIKEAYNQGFKEFFTDDASVLESIGNTINLVDGNRENIKITHEIDLKIAKILMD